MISEIVLLFSRVFLFVSDMADRIFGSTGSLGFVVAAISIAFSVRFLLMPLSPGNAISGSDTAKRIKNRGKAGSSKQSNKGGK